MKAENTPKKIVFIYGLKEADIYMGNRRVIPGAAKELLIAMTPPAYNRLKQHGVEVEGTIRYFTNESHKRLSEKSKILMDWFRENVYFADFGLNIKKAYTDLFILQTRCAVNFCLWASEIIQNAVDTHKPEVIAAFYSGNKSVSSIFVEPGEKYPGYLAKKAAEESGLKFENIPNVNSLKRNTYAPNPVVRAVSLLKPAIKYMEFNAWSAMIFLKNMFYEKNPVLFSAGRGMEAAAEELRKSGLSRPYRFFRGITVPCLDIPHFIIRLFRRAHVKGVLTVKKMFKDLICKMDNEKRLFSHRGIVFSDLVAAKIKNNISAYMTGMILWSIKLDRFIARSGTAIFISDGRRMDDSILAELCAAKRIPALLVSHGSLVRPKNRYEEIEWGEQGRVLLNAPFSHLALQTPLSEGYLDIFPSDAEILKTGPLIWGRPVNTDKSGVLFGKIFRGKRERESTKVILHAGTPKHASALRLHIYETPDEYIRAIRELANCVQKIPDAVLIVRFRPQFGISVEDLKKFIPFSDKVALSVNESFEEILGITDLLVSFSSTTIEEALQNRIPVLLYGGGGRYQHVPACEIKPGDPVKPRAVYHVKKAEDLEKAMDGIFTLDIKGDKDRRLFEPYIYSRHVRTSITDLLKTRSKNGVSLK